MKRSRNWTPDEMAYLVKHYPHLPSKEIADHLGCLVWKVYTKASSLGLKKSSEFMASDKSGRANFGETNWTQADIAYLVKHYPDEQAKNIAAYLGCQISRVYVKARKLGLSKSREFMDSGKSGQLHGERGISNRFRVGMPPWNKGTNYLSGGRSAETQFKTGSKPVNEMPIGSYRINADGCCEYKFGDTPGRADKRWIPVHRKVWIEAHGPIQPGHVIAFKRGMKTTIPEEITIDRIDCISLAENARRNNMWLNNPEWAQLVQIKGQITRQVNRIKDKHKKAEQ